MNLQLKASYESSPPCTCVTHVTHIKEPCPAYEWVVIDITCVTHVNDSWYTYEWVMSHIRMFHVIHHEWVLSHMWMSHVTHANESCPTYMNASHHTYGSDMIAVTSHTRAHTKTRTHTHAQARTHAHTHTHTHTHAQTHIGLTFTKQVTTHAHTHTVNAPYVD